MPENAIELRHVSKSFGTVRAVHDLDLAIRNGETFVIVGPSGCGKTTTLRMVNRLVEPDSGRVFIEGADVRRKEPWELRRRIGYVIQEGGLFAHYTVRRNVAVVPELLGWSRERVARRVDELLGRLGLPPEEFADRYPRQLSGGQRQRVGIARALAGDPPVVLLDEPFGALDPVTREQVQDEFARLSRELDKTFVLITHDVFEAVRLGDRIAVMSDGRVEQCATPAVLVREPAGDLVTAMLGRHRYQLRLMTTPLAEVADRRANAPPEAAKHASVTAEERDTVWTALDLLEREGAEWVHVTGGRDPWWVPRARLLETRRDR